MNIGILLRAPFQALVDKIHSDLAEAGYPEVRPAQGVVFQFIGKNGSRLTELAAKAQMTKQSMSYLVDYLEKEGHVEKAEDESDKRAKIYRLTKKGWKVVAIAEGAIKKFEADCKRRLGAGKYNELVGLLLELRENIQTKKTGN